MDLTEANQRIYNAYDDYCMDLFTEINDNLARESEIAMEQTLRNLITK